MLKNLKRPTYRTRHAIYAGPDGGGPDMQAVAAQIAEIGKAFEAFKEANDAALKGKADVVATEKVDRIGTGLDTLQAGLDEMAKQIAAINALGAEREKDAASPEARAHKKAFEAWFRSGYGEQALKEAEIKAASRTDSKPDGGYLVPDEMDAAISRVQAVTSTMRSISRVQPVGGLVYKKLVGLGGATSGWVGEVTTRSETNTPTLSELSFPTMEIYAMPAATQTMLDDGAVSIEQWLANEVNITFNEQEGSAFISGDGANKPRGITSYTNVANASYAWGSVGYVVSGAAAALHASTPGDAFFDMQTALKTSYHPNAVWLMNRSSQNTIRKIKDSTGQYIWQQSLQIGVPNALLGYPVMIDDNMANIGADAYPVAFGDFRQAYIITDRLGTRILRDPYTSKPYVLFYTTKRVGGGVQNFEAYKLLKIST